MIKTGRDVGKFQEAAQSIVQEIPLEAKYRDHKLVGNYKDHRECHIEPDWLLIYYIAEETVTFVRTGTHSDLF